jgi:hypothetical protein
MLLMDFPFAANVVPERAKEKTIVLTFRVRLACGAVGSGKGSMARHGTATGEAVRAGKWPMHHGYHSVPTFGIGGAA